MNDVRKGMKKSSIRRHLDEKIEEWIESVNDDEVKKIIKNNAIVTGGSIASMLLGDRVNDYDVYFRTFEAAEKVAEYYVRWFNRLREQTSTDVVSIRPEVRTYNLTNIKGEEERRLKIHIQSAGVAGSRQKSYRYFEYSPERGDTDASEKFASSLKTEKNSENLECRPVFLTNNTVSLDNGIQIVLRFHGQPHKIHETFDFTHAKCSYLYKTKSLHLPARSLESLLSRTLVYEGSLYPIASMFRLRKFIRRGWNVSVGQMIKIAWQISELDLKNRDTIMDQLIGVDVAYVGELLDRLEHVNPEMIDSTYIASVVDQIFED